VTDAFLTLLHQGRLALYLGMAPGVHKTIAMLREAKVLLSAGIDVVCGVVETHGREETAAELAVIPKAPRLTIEHAGATLEEMDLDAVLARRPGVVLVDEIAHTNVPGSRHAKRYQDVEALLAAGISVIGTLSVQHLESLPEIAPQEAELDARERVPNRLLERADHIVVIDLAPEEIRECLREGCFLSPDNAESQLESFLRPGNLSALGRLAQREVANAVEAHALARARSVIQGIRSSMPLEPAMACISSETSATRAILARAARLAGAFEAVYAVSVRTTSDAPTRMNTDAARALEDNMALAEKMGSNVVWLRGEDVAAELSQFVRERGVVHAVFGRTHLSAWHGRLRGFIVDRFMRLAPDVDVVVVGAPTAREEEEEHP
jgi:two-component system sensor histidine kinase KdpD